VGADQALDLVHGVHDEHVDQVLARPVQPVVVGRGALRVLQEEGVHVLQDALRLLQRHAPLRRQCACVR